MHGLSTNSRFVCIAFSLGVGFPSFAACSSSTSFDEQSFPPIAETGYFQNAGAAGASAGTASGDTANAGSSGSAAVGSAGSAAMGSAGSAAVSSAGSASTSASSSMGSGGAAASSVGSGATTASGCPADIPGLFQRNISQGGCTNGGICHEAGNQKPDLVSPGLVSRLLNVASTCTKTSAGMSVAPRPYIGKTDSFLEEKIAGTPNADCGFVMPFFMPQALSDSDRKCIVDWIHALQVTDTQ
ncbi:MAG TPA: hypothetical protein VG963_04095 [Polyangiaceae bacterium]|nr:hypothetical protein [Polyangiaceae bacterium]